MTTRNVPERYQGLHERTQAGTTSPRQADHQNHHPRSHGGHAHE